MKAFRLALGMACGGLLCVLPLRAADYYVDFENGNDGAAGLSPATAWKTLPGTRKADNSDWVSYSYGTGVVQRWSRRVGPGTVFRLKAGTRMGAPAMGRLWINSTFYTNATPVNPIVLRVDREWGSGTVVVDGTGVVVPAYYGLVTIESIDCIQLDGTVPDGLRIQNSSFYNLRIADVDFNGSQVRNVEMCNAVRANAIIHSLDKVTPKRIGGVVLDTVRAHGTSLQDDTAGNLYLAYVEDATLRNCECYDAATGADGIHVGGSRNVWVLNCTVHNNGEQGVDLSRDGDYKGRNDTYDITVRDCIGYDNYKQNFDLNSGVHGVRWIGCTAWKTRILERGDGNFHVYQGTAGSNFWINCTSGKGQDWGFGFVWNATLATATCGIAPGYYDQYLVNCVSYGNTGESVYVESDYSNRCFRMSYRNSIFASGRAGVMVREKGRIFSSTDILGGSNGWQGVQCSTTNPGFMAVADAWGACDLRPGEASPCVNGGVFPFLTAAAATSSDALDLNAMVPGVDARRVFLPGDVIMVEGSGLVGVAACESPTRIRLSQPASWAQGRGVWFPWNGSKLPMGSKSPGSRPASPRNLIRTGS